MGVSQQESLGGKRKRRQHQEQETRDDGLVRLSCIPVMLEKGEDTISIRINENMLVLLYQYVFSSHHIS